MVAYLRVSVFAGLLSFLFSCSDQSAERTNTEVESTAPSLTPELVESAYVWGLPIVAMYRYYQLMGTGPGGINQLVHNRTLSLPGQFSGGPNRDGLYSFGWFDLNDEPIVVVLPDFEDRYFVWQMTDLYGNNFHNVGSHLREGPLERYRSGYAFAMVGPDWQGTLPQDVDEVRSPVGVVNVLYRIAVVGETDYPIGNTLQDQTRTIPLSAWEDGVRETVVHQPSNPIPDYREVLAFKSGVAGRDQRDPRFFSVLADAVRANAPYAPWDKKFVATELAQMGFRPGTPFDFEGFDSETQAMILDAQENAFDKLIETGDAEFGTRMNGWLLNPANHGAWKDDFQNRAYGTYTGGMYPVTSNSTYATTYNDLHDQPIDGRFSYVLRFEKDELPPVTNFWSVTAYDAGTRDLYPNEAGLHNYGSNNPDTLYDEDGSVEILFSHAAPEDVTAVNWLPIPEEGAWIVVRFYAPEDEVLNLDYELPGIEKID